MLLACATTAVGLLSVSPATADVGCDVSWVGSPVGGVWSSATSWSTGAVPGSASAVCIPAGATVTVASGTPAAVGNLQAPQASVVVNGGLAIGDASVESRLGTLTLTGTVSGTGQLRVGQTLSMAGWALLTGTGLLVVVEGGASGTITYATIDGAMLRNEGSLMQSGTARLFGKNGAVLDNRGTYTLNTAPCSGCSYEVGVLWSPASGTQPRLLNSGTLRRTAGRARAQ